MTPEEIAKLVKENLDIAYDENEYLFEGFSDADFANDILAYSTDFDCTDLQTEALIPHVKTWREGRGFAEGMP